MTSYTKSEGLMFTTLMLWLFPLALFPRTRANGSLTLPNYSNVTGDKLAVYLTLLFGFALVLVFSYIKYHKEERPGFSLQPVRALFTPAYSTDLLVLIYGVLIVLAAYLSPWSGLHNGVYKTFTLFGHEFVWRELSVWWGAARYDGALFLLSYLLIYWLTSRFGEFRPKQVYGLGIIVFLMCLVSAIQIGGVNALNLYPTGSYPGWFDDFVATIGNIDMMAGFLCMVVPLLGVGYVVFKPNRWFRGVLLLAVAAGMFTFSAMEVEAGYVGMMGVAAVMIPLLLRSRRYALKLMDVLAAAFGGLTVAACVQYTHHKILGYTEVHFGASKAAWLWLALMAVAVVLRLILAARADKREPRWKRVRLLVVAAEVLGVIGAFCFLRFVYLPKAESGLMYDLYLLVRWQLPDSAGHNRIGIWRTSLGMAAQHPWLGVGPGAYAQSFINYAQEVGYTQYANRLLDFAHNNYVHTLCTVGVLGLVAYLGILITAAGNALKQITKNPKLLCLGAACLGYAVQDFFSFSIVITTPLFWTLLGLLVRETRLITVPPKTAEDPPQMAEAPQPAES